jgi:hypothetical protein
MQIQRCIPALLTAAAVVIGGCGDGFAGPEAAGTPEDPSYIALLLPAVQQAREAARRVHTSTGREYDFTIQQTLWANGVATGVAMFSDPYNPSRRVRYQFERGETFCENNTPAVRVQLHVYQCPSDGDPANDCGKAAAGIIGTLAAQVALKDAHPGVDVDARRGEEPTLRWEWERTDPAGREGEFFETPAKVYFSPEICGSR